MAESFSVARESETAEQNFIDEEIDKEYRLLQQELAILKDLNSSRAKEIKGRMNQIIREEIREMKDADNVTVEYPKTSLSEKRELLVALREEIEKKGYGDFQIQYHTGFGGQDHIQIFSKMATQEEISNLVDDYLQGKLESTQEQTQTQTQTQKVEIFDEDDEIQKLLNNIDKQYDLMIEQQKQEVEKIYEETEQSIENINKHINRRKQR